MTGDDLLSVDQLAQYLGVSKSTIYGYRYRNCGPRGFRLAGGNGPVRFRKSDVDSWLAENADTAAA